MSLKQTIYFMALVGGLAGLVCWAVVVWLPEMSALEGLQQNYSWVFGVVNAAFLGALIGGLTVLFADKWSNGQAIASWVVSGTLIGLFAGGLSGLLHPSIGRALGNHRLLALVITWMVTGAAIGFGTGLRWAGVNKLRPLHAVGGGMAGGIVGGLVFAFSPEGASQLSDLFLALGYMFTGMGITCGVTLAPILLRAGILRFISSGDASTQNKYGNRNMEWELQDGESKLAGSQGADLSMSRFGPEVHIFIPDALVSPKHAFIVGRNGQFFVQQHPENRGRQGQPLNPLQVGGQDVIGERQLRHGDNIVLGQTLLRFETKKKE
jgi:FHA domain